VTEPRSPWTFAGSPGWRANRDGKVTLVSGTCFCVSAATGDLVPGLGQGLFYRDTRFLSGWQVMLDGSHLEPLSVISDEAFTATFICRSAPPPGRADSSLLVLRTRTVGEGMHEDIVLRNLAPVPVSVLLTVAFETDFAHLFDVKDGHVPASPPPQLTLNPSAMLLSSADGGRKRAVSVTLERGAVAGPGTTSVRADIAAHSDWSTQFVVSVAVDGQPASSEHPGGVNFAAQAASAELDAWRAGITSIRASEVGIDTALTRGADDLGALRILDPTGSGGSIVAAGAPWFMALFGRDSLITAWMTQALDPALAGSTLSTLASYQGQCVNPDTEEQPGRILHEMRWGLTHPGGAAVGDLYYGTADATPLFVMLLGQMARWGQDPAGVRRLIPSADRALEWIAAYGDVDGDGFVEYERMRPTGLVNQGWKDSWDGINFADGRLAEAPIALCEVQGYVYGAYTARAELAEADGDRSTASHYRDKAAALKTAFNRSFWIADRDYFAVGLDADKKPIDALTSNVGHCLWTGIVDTDKARSVAGHLVSEKMFSGWGIRTLSSEMGAYNPVSYHNGSVWPHDTAIIAAGLARYGYRKEAQRLAAGLLDAAAAFEGRLPELFCGFSRHEFALPVAYPTSCSPQAWASAVPFSLVTTMMGLDPDPASGQPRLNPALPATWGTVTLTGLSSGSSCFEIEASGDKATLRKIPARSVS
jgi:glycogen debranching enzyme